MTYTDKWLRFPDELTALLTVMPLNVPLYRNMDLVGFIDGTLGYHVNVRLCAWESLNAASAVFEISRPQNPKRVWA